MSRRLFPFLFVCLVCAVPAFSQSSPAAADASAVWSALNSPAEDPSRAAVVENIEIVRDRVHLTLKDGGIRFMRPVNGVVFGAVFHGNGRIQLDPPNAIEAQQLQLFTGQPKLDMTFTEATFSFTDGFFDEIAKQVKWQPLSAAPDDLYSKRQQEREDLGEAFLPRLLQAILSADRTKTACFLADLRTSQKDWIELRDDAMAPEQISVGRWATYYSGGRGFDVWTSFPAGGVKSADAWRDVTNYLDFTISSYKIDATVTNGADLDATAHLDISPIMNGQSALLFNFDSNLRLSSVKDAAGKSLAFFQAREDKDRGQSYGDYVVVVLAEPLRQGTGISLDFKYAGKRAIRKVGSGYYYCESSGWYPAVAEAFSRRANFDLTFHSPKHLDLVATGSKTSDKVEGDTRVTTWKSDIPLAVAGFAYGNYKLEESKAGDIAVEVYANRDPDDLMASVQRLFESGQLEGAVGSMSPAAMAKNMNIEVSNMLKVFQLYFGPYPYKQLAVTTLPFSAGYGQGWPGLLYIWSASFLDSTQRNAIGIRDQVGVSDFFRAHETSHQWWGHRVGWKSYHDQWLSEGFADFSGILYVQYRDGMKEALSRWKREKDLLFMKDTQGHVIDSLGPIWLGQRIASSETDPGSYQNLIYSKGAYVLYMIRMQMQDPRDPDPDHLFKAMMQDYCKTYDNRPASTEDFKAIVEKHMTRGMDLDGNHTMDWFFDQYVYGTALPQYEFRGDASPAPDGKTHFHGEITRSGVPASWKDAVPIYAHMGDKTIRLGTVAVTKSPETIDFTIPGKVDRFSINDMEELLADVKQ